MVVVWCYGGGSCSHPPLWLWCGAMVVVVVLTPPLWLWCGAMVVVVVVRVVVEVSRF